MNSQQIPVGFSSGSIQVSATNLAFFAVLLNELYHIKAAKMFTGSPAVS